MFNLLATGGNLGYGVSTISDVSLNWIGKLIRILIEGIGVVGVGIIVFTLILKTIVLPLDIYSKIKGKKQALIMERMRPQMEKLQKQYANDKTMYNQKVMELQKKSGYSVFGACLPMIVSLVIFIIVFNAFSTYSQYANLHSYNNMVKVYNSVVQTYVVEDPTSPTGIEDGFLYAVDADGNQLVLDANGLPADSTKTISDYVADYTRFTTYYNTVYMKDDTEWTAKTESELFLYLAEEYKENNSIAFDTSVLESGDEAVVNSIKNVVINEFMKEPAANAVKAYYESGHNDGFLWIKNIWYPDSTLNKAVPSFSKFQSTVTKASITDDYVTSYNDVTSALGTQKSSYNGYFILIVASIALMLLQQWLSMRSNKSVNDLSTVDGSGARTNKMMMIMMPVIYGIFSFFYSAAFSIYMITNTMYSIVTTLLINKCVDVWFKKKEEKGELDEILTKKSRKKKNKKRV